MCLLLGLLKWPQSKEPPPSPRGAMQLGQVIGLAICCLPRSSSAPSPERGPQQEMGAPRAWAPSSSPWGVLDALPATATALSIRHRGASTQQPCHAASHGIPTRIGASPPQPGTRSSVAAGPCRSCCGNAANRITVQAAPGLMTCFLWEFPGALCRQGAHGLQPAGFVPRHQPCVGLSPRGDHVNIPHLLQPWEAAGGMAGRTGV